MDRKFKRWESEDETRALLIRHCNLEDEIRNKRSYNNSLECKKEALLRNADPVKREFERWAKNEEEQEAKIRNIEQKWDIIKAELDEDQELKDFVRRCSEGIICESPEDVRALYGLQLHTFKFGTLVVVYPNCPKIKEILTEAEQLGIGVKILSADVSTSGGGETAEISTTGGGEISGQKRKRRSKHQEEAEQFRIGRNTSGGGETAQTSTSG